MGIISKGNANDLLNLTVFLHFYQYTIGILLVSQLVLVLMLMLDAYATGYAQKLQLYIVDSTNTRVVGLNV